MKKKTNQTTQNRHQCVFFLQFLKFSVTKPLWIETLDTWTPHIDSNGAIVIANESRTLWNSGFRLVALAIGILIQIVCPTSKKYAVKYSPYFSLVFIILYTTFMITFHIISWFTFTALNILKVSSTNIR